MPPIFGLFFVAIVGIVVLAICAGPPIAVALTSRLRHQRAAWICAAMPSLLLLGAGLHVVLSGTRDEALADSVRRDDAREVRHLLDTGSSADAYTEPFNPYGSPTAIHVAIDHQRWDIVRLLIDHGATDTYLGDDTLFDQSAVGQLEAAKQFALAGQLRKHGPPHF